MSMLVGPVSVFQTLQLRKENGPSFCLIRRFASVIWSKSGSESVESGPSVLIFLDYLQLLLVHGTKRIPIKHERCA